jgi:hypothetical protein
MLPQYLSVAEASQVSLVQLGPPLHTLLLQVQSAPSELQVAGHSSGWPQPSPMMPQ